MKVTLNLPENIYRNYTELAEKNHRRVEEVTADKLRDDFSTETADFEGLVATWSDGDVLALAKLQLPKEQANRMSELSDLKQRGLINNVEKSELKMYLEIYNNANLRKAHGIVEAVKRGLLASPDDLK